MKPGGSILLLKLTKLTNLTKPKLMKKMYHKGTCVCYGLQIFSVKKM